MTWVHTQLNYKRKLQVDQTVFVKTEVLSVRSARTIVTMCMKMQTLAAVWTQTSIDPEAHGNWRGHS